VILLTSNALDTRRRAKHWGDVANAVGTQHVREGKWEGMKDQYCNNVALKFNAKIGGVDSSIDQPTACGFNGWWTSIRKAARADMCPDSSGDREQHSISCCWSSGHARPDPTELGARGGKYIVSGELLAYIRYILSTENALPACPSASTGGVSTSSVRRSRTAEILVSGCSL